VVEQRRRDQLLGKLAVLFVQSLVQCPFGMLDDLFQIGQRFGVQLQFGGLIQLGLTFVGRAHVVTGQSADPQQTQA